MHLDRLVYILLEPRTCTKPKSKFKFEFRDLSLFLINGKGWGEVYYGLSNSLPRCFSITLSYPQLESRKNIPHPKVWVPYKFLMLANHRRNCYPNMLPYTSHSRATHRWWALLCRDFSSETEMNVILTSIELNVFNWTSETACNPPATHRSHVSI